ncbi:hypothetical protein FB567DRAFT_618742 [Paraphoma chrysanthemicola]|uniref:Uncharacterized protein n=1 Tax=Paraphoma chrysanthemicola TaxID=798071 RepID=A0A8K0RB55_9PLEO|nr:hypothetical protein FB567DRAFT_618742 [Paraphoma chrysanthemicola]
MSDTSYRQRDGNSDDRWPDGVLSGGMVIDLLECLSRTTREPDYALVLWLKAHYIEPFGRIERLDGLVVTETQDHMFIHRAHERFIDVQGYRSKQHKLWVTGLEPIDEIITQGRLPQSVPRNTEYEAWRASDMSFKNGIEVARKGKFEGTFLDKSKWERKIWSVPGAKKECEKEEPESVKVERKDEEDAKVKLEEPDKENLANIPSPEHAAKVSPKTPPRIKAPSPEVSADIWYMSSPEHTRSA